LAVAQDKSREAATQSWEGPERVSPKDDWMVVATTSFFDLDSVLLQQEPQLLIERPLAMMLRLTMDVIQDSGLRRLAHAEGRETFLPFESRLMRMTKPF
jgi:hypothetical protein